MEPVFIYFKEIPAEENSKFTLDFSQTDQIYKVHFSPQKNYYLTSMNCDLDLQENIKNDGVLDEIKKLSEKSRLLLEKGPAYQNDIKKITLVVGFAGTIIGKIPFDFQLTTERINQYSWSYKFYDSEKYKVRDCKTYSLHDHLQNDRFILKSDTFTGGSTHHVSLDEKM